MQPHEDPVIMDAVRAAKHVQDVLRDAHPQAADIVLSQAALDRQFRQTVQDVCGLSVQGLSGEELNARLRTTLPDAYLGLVLDVFKAFTDARNGIAHGKSPDEVERRLSIFRQRFEHVGVPLNPATVRYATAAVGVASMLSMAISEARAAQL